MFAATQDKDGTYRLSVRRIRTIRTFHDSNNKPVQITFASRAKAKACADELNENTEYDYVFDKYTGLATSYDKEKITATMIDVLAIVREHMEQDSSWISIGDYVFPTTTI